MKLFKPYLIAAAATLLAVGSYSIAWFNIQNTSLDKPQKLMEISSVEEVYSAIPIIKIQKTPQAMSQNEVSVTVTALSYHALSPQKNWQAHSKATVLNPHKSYIALIIDDMGVVEERTRHVINVLPKAVTLSFLPYGKSTLELSKIAYHQGHEIMVHLPMEPKLPATGIAINPGDNALYTTLNLSDIAPVVQKNLKDLSSIAVGVNNHMGSKFTEWGKGLKEVFKVIEKHELMFLDSLTTPKSAGSHAVQGYDIPFLKRNVFLDHVVEKAKILEALEKTERIAKLQGYAIAIGHPHVETTAVIKLWAQTLKDKNIQLVPITALIKGNER